MLTISRMARKYHLSRSTLLYYDRIGLLSPHQRTGSGYRVYSERDCLLMDEISRLRNAGIPLREIRKLISGGSSRRAEILRMRLRAINEEISHLRKQQNFIINLLDDKALVGSARVMTKGKWIDCLRKAGLDESGMDRWHAEFEASAPEAHQDFLESLNLNPDEICFIRKRGRDMIRSPQVKASPHKPS